MFREYHFAYVMQKCFMTLHFSLLASEMRNSFYLIHELLQTHVFVQREKKKDSNESWDFSRIYLPRPIFRFVIILNCLLYALLTPISVDNKNGNVESE